MRTNEMPGSYVFNAYRQVWLASLGAAVVTREWAQAEAAPMFRKFVKEGTLVESRTFRLVGDRIEGSVTRANAVWKRYSSTMRDTVRQAADTAVTLVQNNLPKVTLPSMLAPAKPAKKRAAKARKSVKVRKTATRAAKRTKARTAK